MTGPVTAASYLAKAERALKEALMLLREKATEGACNRAYYAMHDAAHAALLAGDHETPDSIIKTHHGLIAEFGRQLVQSGQLDAAFGRDFNRVETIRLAADYLCEPPPLADATAAVEKAEQFVAAVRRLMFAKRRALERLAAIQTELDRRGLATARGAFGLVEKKPNTASLIDIKRLRAEEPEICARYALGALCSSRTQSSNERGSAERK